MIFILSNLELYNYTLVPLNGFYLLDLRRVDLFKLPRFYPIFYERSDDVFFVVLCKMDDLLKLLSWIDFVFYNDSALILLDWPIRWVLCDLALIIKFISALYTLVIKLKVLHNILIRLIKIHKAKHEKYRKSVSLFWNLICPWINTVVFDFSASLWKFSLAVFRKVLLLFITNRAYVFCILDIQLRVVSIFCFFK